MLKIFLLLAKGYIKKTNRNQKYVRNYELLTPLTFHLQIALSEGGGRVQKVYIGS